MSTISDPTQSGPGAEARLEELAQEWSALDAAKQPILDRMEQIKAEYRRILSVGDKVHAAGRSITISRNARLDTEAFMKAYPVLSYPDLWTTTPVPNMEAIKYHIPRALLQTFQKEGQPTVTIR